MTRSFTVLEVLVSVDIECSIMKFSELGWKHTLVGSVKMHSLPDDEQ
jgi:hypothetical protein